MSVSMVPHRVQRDASLLLPQQAEQPFKIIELWSYGMLYWMPHSCAAQGLRQVVLPVRQEHGKKLYHINASGFYELLAPDRLLRFECWKGIVEVIEHQHDESR